MKPPPKPWPAVPLGEILTKSDEWIELQPDRTYRQVTVRLWGKGVTLRGEVTGAEIAAPRQCVVHARQFIASRIDARNGAFGLIPDSLEGAVVTSDFPVFSLNETRMLPEYLHWLSKTGGFVDLCKAASEGTTNRVRLKEDRFLALQIPLPPLAEQRRIVARIEQLAAQINEVRGIRSQVEIERDQLLMAAYRRIIDGAPRKRMGDAAPLTRRPVTVDTEKEYPQIAVRSFGRGAFHKPLLAGSEVTWQKPYLVRAGDILISNIKAWEGAIAVAGTDDSERVASHRYLTCVPTPGVATARFVCFHLLTPEGLYHVGEASPGSADRNRTLSAKALLEIPIPVPAYEKQVWFDGLVAQVTALTRLQSETAAELDALLPSILDQAFHGQL
ncbi:MAG: restriction endonuclease subunit S [Verrucomicrobiia bacterium]